MKTNDDGSLPSADTIVTNLGDLPGGAKVRRGKKTEEIAKNLKSGESAKIPIVIIVPSEGEKIVETTITRPAAATNNSQANANNSNENKAHNTSKVAANELPQTDENSVTLSALGIALVGVVSLGLFLKKKKEDQ